MSGLKPCPFCGTSDVKYFDNEPPFEGYVLCNQCHTRGPRMPSSAVSKWNTRADTHLGYTAKMESAGEMAGAPRLLDTEEALPEYAINALQKWEEAQDGK